MRGLNMAKLREYAKAIAALAGFVGIVANGVADGSLSPGDVYEAGIALAVALGVYRIPNQPAA